MILWLLFFDDYYYHDYEIMVDINSIRYEENHGFSCGIVSYYLWLLGKIPV